MKKPLLIIIRGTSGSGKSTIAGKIAREKKTVLFSSDVFYFEMLPYKPENKEHFEMGNAYLEACLITGMKYNKNIILEGALISTDKRTNSFDISQVLKLAKKYKYSVVMFKFLTNHTVALKRMTARNNIVPEDIFKKIDKALQKSIVLEEKVIYTDRMSQEEVLQLVTSSL